MEKIDSFKIIGIVTETSNENGKASEDLGKLWQKFYSENIPDKIPHKIGNEIYSIYTDYKTNHTGNYTCIIGFKVDSIEEIPEGLVGKEIGSGNYHKYIAKGEMPDAVVNAWKEIWKNNADLNRTFTADFEVYGDKSQNGGNSEVEIFIATDN
ncbi:MAG: GyrI-like domain-containing protein [Weeksellaceae bacterium]